MTTEYECPCGAILSPDEYRCASCGTHRRETDSIDEDDLIPFDDEEDECSSE